MKVRRALPALGVAVLAMSLLPLASTQVQAAESSVATAPAVAPAGQALIRIDGGTAYARKKSHGQYRVVVPQGASVQWYGEVAGGKTAVGTFSPKALVAGWVRLGHRDGAPALTTLTWSKAGRATPTFRQAQLSKPRINADGQLTFLASPTTGGLPERMKAFSININRAQTGGPSPRFTVSGPNIFIDSQTWMRADQTDNTKTMVFFSTGTASNTCTKNPFLLVGGTAVTVSADFSCGQSIVKKTQSDGATASYFQLTLPASYAKNPDPPTSGQANYAFSVTPAAGGTAMPFAGIMVMYQSNGAPVPNSGSYQD